MGGGVEVEEVPYNYAYRGYPFGAPRIPVYNSSFPEFWNDGRGSFHDESVYGGRGVPMFGQYNGDADSIVRKRKLDGLKGEEIPSRGRNVIGNIPVENGSNARAGVSGSAPMHSPTVSLWDRATTRAHDTQSSYVDATSASHPFPPNFVRDASQPRVISIPVISTDEGKGHSVKCTVIPQEGTKKLRKAMSDEEAAVLVQSCFKGYQVRKTAPLTQLRRVADVKSQLKNFEQKISDAEFINYARENSVAKLKLTEGLMNLLLELDSIQGAHPAVRAVRKDVTKEVIALQGRVDSLLSDEMADMEVFNLPMEVEENSRDEVDQEEVTATASHSSESVAAIPKDALEEETDFTESQFSESVAAIPKDALEEEADFTACAEPDPDQDKSEVSAMEGDPQQMKIEPCEVCDAELNCTSSAQMVSYPDEGASQDLKNHEPKEMMEADPDSHDEGISQELKDREIKEMMEADPVSHDEENEPDKDGTSQTAQMTTVDIDETLQVAQASNVDADEAPQAAQVTKVDDNRIPETTQGKFLEPEVVGTNADGAAPSVLASEIFPNEGLEERRPTLGTKTIDNGLRNAGDQGKRCDGVNGKGDQIQDTASSPYSPKSPLEATEWLNSQPPNSDSEPESPEIIQSVPAQSKGDHGALLLKLSEENKVLKSLLVTVMKWNQMQATTMQDVKHRLGKLESRVGNKKSSSRRKGGKTRRMILS